ncbi:MAG: NAD+ synthase [bacterium]
MRIALAQMNPIVGDIDGNGSKIIHWIKKARRYRVDLIAFPELVICGYPAEDLLLKPGFVKRCHEAIKEIARQVEGTVAIVGFPRQEGLLFNSAAVIANGDLVGYVDKVELPNYGVFDEKRYFTSGEIASVVEIDGKLIGVSICEDIWEANVPAAQAGAGAQLLLNISCSPYHIGKGKERHDLMARRACENIAWVAYLNLVGGQDELVFDGHSIVVDPGGNPVAIGRQFEEDLIIADIEIGSSQQRIESIRSEGINLLKVSQSLEKQKPQIKRKIPRQLGRIEEIYKALVVGTRDYVRKNGFDKVVVGLSGGIDSSLVAVIASDALGVDKVIGVSMPSRYSSKESISDARKLAKALGMKFVRIDIDPIFQTYLDAVSGVFRGLPHDETEENLQARIRGSILMALSNKFGYMVLTTGNKSELGVGYCTLYGDLAGGYAILKDVPKTMVYELARYRNAKEKVIPESVFVKPPSAELRPNQRDEDSLPPYEILDPILEMYVVKDMSIGEIVESGYPEEVVVEVVRKVDRSEYKRRQGPPGIKITPRAFGKDRRMPITNLYDGR